jgi:hypothetical protein
VGVHPICFIANLLAPRIKLIWSKLSVDDCQEIKEKVLEMIAGIYEKINPPIGQS